MKYLCLCYYNTQQFEAMTPADLEQLGAECGPHDERLKKSGHVPLIGSLALPGATKTLRPAGGGIAVSDGPYEPTPNPLGAFFLVDASSMDEAIAIAKLHPGAHLTQFEGGIEVRECDHFEEV